MIVEVKRRTGSEWTEHQYTGLGEIPPFTGNADTPSKKVFSHILQHTLSALVRRMHGRYAMWVYTKVVPALH